MTSRRELGTFCEQFGYKPLTNKKNLKNKICKNCNQKKVHKIFYNKPYKKPKARSIGKKVTRKPFKT